MADCENTLPSGSVFAMKAILGWLFFAVAFAGFYGLAYYIPYTATSLAVFIGSWIGAASVLALCYVLVRAGLVQSKYGLTLGYWVIAISFLGFYWAGVMGAIMQISLGQWIKAIQLLGIHGIPLVASTWYVFAVNKHADPPPAFRTPG